MLTFEKDLALCQVLLDFSLDYTSINLNFRELKTATKLRHQWIYLSFCGFITSYRNVLPLLSSKAGFKFPMLTYIPGDDPDQSSFKLANLQASTETNNIDQVNQMIWQFSEELSCTKGIISLCIRYDFKPWFILPAM